MAIRWGKERPLYKQLHEWEEESDRQEDQVGLMYYEKDSKTFEKQLQVVVVGEGREEGQEVEVGKQDKGRQ